MVSKPMPVVPVTAQTEVWTLSGHATWRERKTDWHEDYYMVQCWPPPTIRAIEHVME